MAKELPYFQFEPAAYLSGDIQFCSLEAQGLYVNIEAIYWQKSCQVTVEQINRKFKRPELIDELVAEKIIKIEGSKIQVDFLLKQFESISAKKLILSKAGKRGSVAKKQATLKPPLSHPLTPLKHLDKIREEEIRKELLQQQRWCEEICMKHKIKMDSLPVWIEKFQSHLVTIAEVHDTQEKFKYHFTMWMGKQPKNIGTVMQVSI